VNIYLIGIYLFKITFLTGEEDNDLLFHIVALKSDASVTSFIVKVCKEHRILIHI